MPRTFARKTKSKALNPLLWSNFSRSGDIGERWLF
jgi:hypothetical protein